MLKKDPEKRPSVQELMAMPCIRPEMLAVRNRAVALQPDLQLLPLFDPIAPSRSGRFSSDGDDSMSDQCISRHTSCATTPRTPRRTLGDGDVPEGQLLSTVSDDDNSLQGNAPSRQAAAPAQGAVKLTPRMTAAVARTATPSSSRTAAGRVVSSSSNTGTSSPGASTRAASAGRRSDGVDVARGTVSSLQRAGNGRQSFTPRSMSAPRRHPQQHQQQQQLLQAQQTASQQATQWSCGDKHQAQLAVTAATPELLPGVVQRCEESRSLLLEEPSSNDTNAQPSSSTGLDRHHTGASSDVTSDLHPDSAVRALSFDFKQMAYGALGSTSGHAARSPGASKALSASSPLCTTAVTPSAEPSAGGFVQAAMHPWMPTSQSPRSLELRPSGGLASEGDNSPELWPVAAAAERLSSGGHMPLSPPGLHRTGSSSMARTSILDTTTSSSAVGQRSKPFPVPHIRQPSYGASDHGSPASGGPWSGGGGVPQDGADGLRQAWHQEHTPTSTTSSAHGAPSPAMSDGCAADGPAGQRLQLLERVVKLCGGLYARR